MNRCFGLGSPIPHPDALPFGAAVPIVTVPDAVDYHAALNLDPNSPDALGNDTWSNCVSAREWRLAQMRQANAAGSSWTPTADQAVGTWAAMNGLDLTQCQPPGPGTDLAVAQAWVASKGLQINEQTLDITKPVTVNANSVAEVRRAIYVCCGVGLAFLMPQAWDDESIRVWDVAPNGIRTGAWAPALAHAVPSGKFDGQYFYVISWGYEIAVTLKAFMTYVLAVDAALSPRVLDWRGISPAGLTMAQSQMAEDTKL